MGEHRRPKKKKM